MKMRKWMCKYISKRSILRGECKRVLSASLFNSTYNAFPSPLDYIVICNTSLVQFFNYLFFLAFEFCRFWVVIRFFHPRHNDFEGFSIPDLIRYIFFSYLKFSERATSISLVMLSAKQVKISQINELNSSNTCIDILQ